MKTIIYNLFGAYVPVSYILDDGSEIIPDGLAGCDVPYILGVILFGIFLYQILAVVRGMINRG